MAIIYLLTRIKPGFIYSSSVIGIGDPVASVGRLSFSITDRRNSSQARQTPPVGRSETLTGPSFLLQWSSTTNPCIFRQHYRAKKESFIE